MAEELSQEILYAGKSAFFAIKRAFISPAGVLTMNVIFSFFANFANLLTSRFSKGFKNADLPFQNSIRSLHREYLSGVFYPPPRHQIRFRGHDRPFGKIRIADMQAFPCY